MVWRGILRQFETTYSPLEVHGKLLLRPETMAGQLSVQMNDFARKMLAGLQAANNDR